MAEPMLAGIADELPVAVAVLRSDGLLQYANLALAERLGQEHGSLLGRGLDETLGSPGSFADLSHESSGGQVELSCRRADGTEIWLLASSRPMNGTDARVAVFIDGTERHRIEVDHGAQTAALARLAELPEKNPGPVGRLTLEADVLMANAAARSFIGEGDLDGRCWVDVCPGVTWELWRKILAASRGSGERVRHEAERDGTWVMFTYVPSQSGDVIFVYGADITARRRDEALLAEQAATLAEVARFPEMNPGPVLRMDTAGKVLMANAAARNVFGEALVGHSWLELCPPIGSQAWADALASQEVVFLEAQIGDRYYVFAHRFDPRTQLMFVFGADVTAQKLAERALRQSERMATLGTLAAGVAHELNNPAAATRRAAEQLRQAFGQFEVAQIQLDATGLTPETRALLEEFDERAQRLAGQPADLSTLDRGDREADVEDWLDDRGVEDGWDLAPSLVAQDMRRQDLDRLALAIGEERLPIALALITSAFRVHMLAHEIGEGTGRISEIVGALKSYSYLGQAPVQAVNIHEGLDNTLVILRNKLKQGIEVSRKYGGDVPRISAFGSELNQVWTNLIDNAADAMDGQGHIEIRTRRDGDWVLVEIEDDGPGIPQPIQHQVFDPFFTTKEPGKGTGLGLSTTYSIITEKHHGTITLRSAPGKTCFSVRLPIESAAPGATVQQDRAAGTEELTHDAGEGGVSWPSR
jgi:PAS domain S-box-containing protein